MYIYIYYGHPIIPIHPEDKNTSSLEFAPQLRTKPSKPWCKSRRNRSCLGRWGAEANFKRLRKTCHLNEWTSQLDIDLILRLKDHSWKIVQLANLKTCWTSYIASWNVMWWCSACVYIIYTIIIYLDTCVFSSEPEYIWTYTYIIGCISNTHSFTKMIKLPVCSGWFASRIIDGGSSNIWAWPKTGGTNHRCYFLFGEHPPTTFYKQQAAW